MSKTIQTPKGTLVFSEPEIYVDNKARGRSGHMSHAMVEYAPGKIIDFNSNCSNKRCNGHAAFGWIEYRYSEDNGHTWGEIHELPYAKEQFFDGRNTISVEKALLCDDGTLVAFCLRNNALTEISCEPWDTPMCVRSFDYGKTWTEAVEVSPYKGRIYDARKYNGSLFFIMLCNDATDSFIGSKPEHVYRLYRSDDNGRSFYEASVVDMPSLGRGYGSMIFHPNGDLYAYTYILKQEDAMDLSISHDQGKTWERMPQVKVVKRIRNPQIAYLDGIYVLHGRAGSINNGFVFYTSEDGINWDDGMLFQPAINSCYYSNNLVLNGANGKHELLIQYSHTFEFSRVNVMHTRLTWAD